MHRLCTYLRHDPSHAKVSIFEVMIMKLHPAGFSLRLYSGKNLSRKIGLIVLRNNKHSFLLLFVGSVVKKLLKVGDL